MNDLWFDSFSPCCAKQVYLKPLLLFHGGALRDRNKRLDFSVLEHVCHERVNVYHHFGTVSIEAVYYGYRFFFHFELPLYPGKTGVVSGQNILAAVWDTACVVCLMLKLGLVVSWPCAYCFGKSLHFRAHF